MGRLAAHRDVELIVVDGGSTDRSAAIARQFTPYVFIGPAGRATQLNTGARHATGDILLFLPADSFLLRGALEELKRRIIGDGAIGGAFDLQFDTRHWLYRHLATASNHRARLLRRPRGDQGLFVWRQVFELLGRFPEIPILEDVAFVRRLRRAGRLTFLRSGLLTSARRWEVQGPLKTALVNAWVSFLFTLRIPPRHLRRIHDGWLGAGNQARQPTVAVSHAGRD